MRFRLVMLDNQLKIKHFLIYFNMEEISPVGHAYGINGFLNITTLPLIDYIAVRVVNGHMINPWRE